MHPDVIGIGSPALLAARLLRLAFIAAGLLLAAVWLTRVSAPRPVAALATSAVPGPAPNTAAALKVFGIGVGTAGLASGVELTGIYARGDGRGFATFRSPRGALSGVAGDEIEPGVQLARVDADRVVLRVGGADVRLALPAQPAAPLDMSASNQP